MTNKSERWFLRCENATNKRLRFHRCRISDGIKIFLSFWQEDRFGENVTQSGYTEGMPFLLVFDFGKCDGHVSVNVHSPLHKRIKRQYNQESSSDRPAINMEDNYSVFGHFFQFSCDHSSMSIIPVLNAPIWVLHPRTCRPLDSRNRKTWFSEAHGSDLLEDKRFQKCISVKRPLRDAQTKLNHVPSDRPILLKLNTHTAHVCVCNL